MEKEDDETSEDNDEINGDELQQAYEKLYEESLNFSKINYKLSLKLKACESENVKLKGELVATKRNVIKISSDRQDLCGKLLSCETERNELLKVYSIYEEKLESLEMSQATLEEIVCQKDEELCIARATIAMWNKGSKSLEDILGSQQMGYDKSGLGYGATAHKGQSSTSLDLKTQAKGKLKVDQCDPSLHLPKGGKINKMEVNLLLFVITMVGMATFVLIALNCLVRCLKRVEIRIFFGLGDNLTCLGRIPRFMRVFTMPRHLPKPKRFR